jgi:hypothetical protein
MSTSDKINLFLAIAAGVSAAVALAAFIFTLVARRDSKRSAEAAEKSAIEARRANDLTAQQVEIASSELKRQLRNDIKDSQPCFTWDESSAGAQSVTYKLKNHGGTISDVEVTCQEGFQAFVSPKDVIPQGTEAEVRFICNIQPQPNPFKFFIKASDRFNQRSNLAFTIYRRAGGYWQLPELSQN